MILANRLPVEMPAVRNDEAYDMLAGDPTMPQFPPGTNYDYLAILCQKASQAVTNVPVPVLTEAKETTAANNAEVFVENSNVNWVNNKWRPAMGWMYMMVCIFDFIIFPILWSMLQAFYKGQVTQEWQPLTLQGGGLFHVAMGAVLGIAAYGRTKEKLADIK